MEKNSQTNRVRNEKVLNIVKKDRNILHTVKRRRAKKKKRDKSQLILPFIGFGYMFRNKSILHQALIQDKQQV
jgi:DNA-binding response OmpR family regulator